MPNQYTGRRLVPCTCAHCGQTYETWPSRATQGRLQFCSRQCHADWKYAQAVASLREPMATRLPNGCLIFNGKKNERGYGRLKVRGIERPAHVVAWEIANALPFPDNAIGCHDCPGGDNPSCVEPAPIWPGTNAANSADMVAKGRAARGERVGTSKLTAEAVRDIRARYAADEASQETLAFEYGVSQSLISMIILRQSWRHLDP